MRIIKNKLLVIGMLITAFLFTSCVNDLNVEPIDPNINTANKVFKNKEAYKQALAKLYASYAVSGQTGGGGGSPDIQGIDEGFGNYLRSYWNLQELPTDEAIMAWDDQTIKDFHWQTWAANDVFIFAMYSRIIYTVSICNEFIRNVNDKLGSVSGDFKTDLEHFKAEARFLRALSYWHAIDMFGNVPFITEKDKVGAFFPKQISRSALFDYVVSELLAIENQLVPAKQNEYARADQGAAWFLLAKLYLNSDVYTGKKQYSEVLTYVNKVIAAGYSLEADYANLFTANNNLSNEIIFPITFDGQNTQQYGGMTFLLHASNGGGMPLYGIDGGWGGIRTIDNFVSKFNLTKDDFSSANPQYQGPDKRGMFFFNPENWEWDITNVGTFTQGIGVTKYKNTTSSGGEAPNAHPTYVSTDFPMFRLGDAYLMYAEAVVRGGAGGDMGTAVGYINDLRERAYGDNSGNITAGDVDLNFLLNERARELYWEAHRRTDLIRFGQLTDGDYVWAWKGKVEDGKQTPAYRNLYPIPASDMNANPNLKQNTGY
ncbi:MAG: RagB/SusD family nutrient uptake outer membrane protein [Ignavibacteriae bacterium]|nr:MAG: RagB/SusD family nutrient uptake outer membrane protein [Ignavibacteriota bacterium]